MAIPIFRFFNASALAASLSSASLFTSFLFLLNFLVIASCIASALSILETEAISFSSCIVSSSKALALKSSVSASRFSCFNSNKASASSSDLALATFLNSCVIASLFNSCCVSNASIAASFSSCVATEASISAAEESYADCNFACANSSASSIPLNLISSSILAVCFAKSIVACACSSSFCFSFCRLALLSLEPDLRNLFISLSSFLVVLKLAVCIFISLTSSAFTASKSFDRLLLNLACSFTASTFISCILNASAVTANSNSLAVCKALILSS